LQAAENFARLFFRASLNVSAPDLKPTDALAMVLIRALITNLPGG
jgi:hypothetical protein